MNNTQELIKAAKEAELDSLDFESGTATFAIPEGSRWVAGKYFIISEADALASIEQQPTGGGEEVSEEKLVELLKTDGGVIKAVLKRSFACREREAEADENLLLAACQALLTNYTITKRK